VSESAQTFDQLANQLGGFHPDAVASWGFVKSPLALSHWTMNVVEILLITGALWGLVHAVTRFKQGHVVYLAFWLASVVFMLALEIPVYFPEKLGGDETSLFFIHNEFTVQFFFGRAPLYILALYPAVMYSSFVLVKQAGLFEGRFGALSGAVAVGLVHHVFYEVFDHYGPQYGWWLWNYPNFNGSLASVPVSSMVSFAFIGPIALTLATRLLVTTDRYEDSVSLIEISSRIQFAARAVAAGLLTPILFVLLTAETWYELLTIELTTQREAYTAIALLGSALTLTVLKFSRTTEFSMSGLLTFSKVYLLLFLAVFLALWLYALPDYLSAVDGVTSWGSRTGSLLYALGCIVLGIFFLLRTRRGAPGRY